MNRYALGALAILVVAVSVWLSRTALSGQAPPPASVPTPVQTIKITLYDDGKGKCVLDAIPDVGFYAGDSIVWNVENGCKSAARVTIGNLKQVSGPPVTPFAGGVLPREVSLTARSETSRTQVVTSATNEPKPPPGTPTEYEYDVEQNEPAGTTIKGRAYFCREPPCPPRKGGD
jgi:hypothetical protein